MIKNIIFDFGDIFINLDKPATLNKLEALRVSKISNEMINTYHLYEMGLISTDKFLEFFYEKFQIPKEELILAWNAILLDFPLKRLNFLKELQNQNNYRLFLLSNTNDLHISWIKNDWGQKLYSEFKNCFEQFYLSHEINLRKPNKNIYDFVLEQNNLIANETFFIDDTKENTESAKELGIKVWNLIPEKEDVVNLQTRKEFLD